MWMKPNSLEPPTDATMQEWIIIGPVCTVSISHFCLVMDIPIGDNDKSKKHA